MTPDHLKYCNTDKQRMHVQAVIDEGSISAAARKLGIARQSLQTSLRAVLKRSRADPSPDHQKADSKRLVITWAQNATPVNAGFFASLKTYCEHNNGQLIVIKGRYKNPTSMWSKNNEHDEWWDASLTPHLADNRLTLNRNLALFADIKIIPTAVKPLSGLLTMSGQQSCIFGHPSIHSRTVATVKDKMAKICATTGAITRKNYTDSKAGKKGEFSHEYGACVVELSSRGIFHIRQVIYDGSGFYDLDKYYTADAVSGGKTAAGFVSGDFHGIWLDQKVKQAWWNGKDALLSLIRPERQYFHDVLDTYWGSHHHESDPFLKIRKHFSGLSDGTVEIEKTLKELADCALCEENFVVASNHDEHFTRWLCERDWKRDPVNAELYLDTALQYVRAAKAGKSFNPLEYWSDKYGNEKLTYLSRWDSSVTADHECAFHGDKGPNGARGSIEGFDKIGSKTATGHGHGPGRSGGALRVGISCRADAEYTAGTPSDWMHTGAILYKNGKATLVTAINGEYRLAD